MMTDRNLMQTLLLTVTLVVAACDNDEESSSPSEEGVAVSVDVTNQPSPAPIADAADASAENRRALFGELHIHTSWSPDAYIFNVRVTPDHVYKYAKGEAIPHVSGKDIRISKPLDFAAVTDHAVYMGILPAMADPANPLSELSLAKEVISPDPKIANAGFQKLFDSVDNGRAIAEINRPEINSDTWSRIVAAADRHYEPGEFTTFAAYEWTSIPNAANLHRNVVFRGTENLPSRPFSLFDSDKPEDLWAWMDAQRERGVELLAIPHNSNLSDGLMFPMFNSRGAAIDPLYAATRRRNEPLVEVTQIKGTSETHPLLSPTDEFADFEILEELLGAHGRKGKVPGSYAREALKNGLVLDQAGIGNPYKFGLIGASDSHNASTPVEEDNYTGKIGIADGTPETRLFGGSNLTTTNNRYSASGLAGVWAEENTREAIFDALKRKETFATSGPRMRIRFFAGWNLGTDLTTDPDWVAKAYAGGVPMGGELTASEAAASPTFVVWAIKDPDAANLDRIQIVKGWVDSFGVSHEKIYDVALSDGRMLDPKTGEIPPVGNTVDLKTASWIDSIGDVELATEWSDPNFDPAEAAFYYVRVLQIPTPRWSTYDAMRLGVEIPEGLPGSIQERAWSSPIWYAP